MNLMKNYEDGYRIPGVQYPVKLTDVKCKWLGLTLKHSATGTFKEWEKQMTGKSMQGLAIKMAAFEPATRQKLMDVFIRAKLIYLAVPLYRMGIATMQ